MKTLLVWLWLSQSADIATTTVALHRGCVERTYYSGNPAIIASGKLGSALALSFTASHFPHGGKVLVTSLAVASTAAALLNTHTMRSCR